nr:hypothetical protein [Microcoleus sp. PH2017_15_JOR_U_A]
MIVLDMQPLFGGDADYRAKYTRSIAQFLQAHQPYLSWGGDFPEEAQQFFQAGVAVDSPLGNGSCEDWRFRNLERLSGC